MTVVKTTLIKGVGWPVFEGLPQRFKHESKPIRIIGKSTKPKKKLSKGIKHLSDTELSPERLNSLSEALMDSEAQVYHPKTKESKDKGAVIVSKHPLLKSMKELENFETRKSVRKSVHLNLKKGISNATLAK